MTAKRLLGKGLRAADAVARRVPGGDGLLRTLWPRSVVLLYHRIAAPATDPLGLAVRPETFERQLATLGRRLTVVPLAEILESVARRKPAAGTVALTFDDGYEDNLTTAVPLAASAGVPITVFVCAQPVLGNADAFWWDELTAIVAGAAAPVTIPGLPPLRTSSAADRAASRTALHAALRALPGARRTAALRDLRAASGTPAPADTAGRPLTADQLRALAASPDVTIGAHTMTHPSLAALAPEEQRVELRECRSALSEFLGRPVESLAYPFGGFDDVSATTRALAREAGYAAALTTEHSAVSRTTQVFAIPRLSVHEWTDEEFLARVRGLAGC